MRREEYESCPRGNSQRVNVATFKKSFQTIRGVLKKAEFKPTGRFNFFLTMLPCFPVVVDAYSAWCGPCKAIVSTLKRIKNELGDDLLHFATVSVKS